MPEDRTYLAPLSDRLLRLALRGLALPPKPAVLDLCCGSGAASHLMAAELDADCTGVDLDEELLRTARAKALSAGRASQLDFIRGDARHVELTNHSFDLVLALGGALTYMDRPQGLERIRQLLKPGGALLLSDLIYLDSPVPEEVRNALQAAAPENEVRPLGLAPAVRAVFEEGVYRFETEESYHALLAAFGYDSVYSFLVPESAWNRYYRDASALLSERGGRAAVQADELAAFYCWGGRWGLGYLVCGAVARTAG